jgi:hypothetical protein
MTARDGVLAPGAALNGHVWLTRVELQVERKVKKRPGVPTLRAFQLDR